MFCLWTNKAKKPRMSYASSSSFTHHSIHHQACQSPLRPGRPKTILNAFPLPSEGWRSKLWPVDPFLFGKIQISNIQTFNHHSSQFIITRSVNFYWNLTGQQHFWTRFYFFGKTENQNLICKSIFIRWNTNFEHSIITHHDSSSLGLSVSIGIWQVNNNFECASTFFEKLKAKTLTCKSVFIRRNTNLEHSITAHHHQTCQSSVGPDRSTTILNVPSLPPKGWNPKIWPVSPPSLGGIQALNIQPPLTTIHHH